MMSLSTSSLRLSSAALAWMAAISLFRSGVKATFSQMVAKSSSKSTIFSKEGAS